MNTNQRSNTLATPTFCYYSLPVVVGGGAVVEIIVVVSFFKVKIS